MRLFYCIATIDSGRHSFINKLSGAEAACNKFTQKPVYKWSKKLHTTQNSVKVVWVDVPHQTQAKPKHTGRMGIPVPFIGGLIVYCFIKEIEDV